MLISWLRRSAVSILSTKTGNGCPLVPNSDQPHRSSSLSLSESKVIASEWIRNYEKQIKFMP